ncbi:MAG TPA: hypothetical protein DEF78_04515 [Sphingobacterium sp.]|nr:hypothetical protein [Sphingobacterium sp.]
MKTEGNNFGGLDQIQPPLWDATNDRTDHDEVAERLSRLQQAWQKNKFKPTTRMEYLMRRIRGIWRRLVFRVQVMGDKWSEFMQSEKALFAIGAIIFSLCILIGLLLGIYFPD